MNTLNEQQLAFVLQVTKKEARAKMCHAWCKFHDIQNEAYVTDKNKIHDEYPKTMPIGILSQGLNIPDLQQIVDDIELHYLDRPATKKWILCDYPENELRLKHNKGDKLSLNIPSGLKQFLPDLTQETIKKEWRSRFPNAVVK